MLASRSTLLARSVPLPGPSRALSRGFACSSVAGKERLVILGSGWGGYNLARKADKSLYDVTVISPNSYFSFTPLLASTCVGTLDFRCAIEPVRGIRDVVYHQAWADKIDFEKRTVHVGPALPSLVDNLPEHPGPTKGAELYPSYTPADAYDVPYDKLVIATGCRAASFGTPGVLEYAQFLKDVREARAIRVRLLECLEMASEPHCTPEKRKQLLSFCIVGGGPTGVEFAAELHDFVKSDVKRLYPDIHQDITIKVFDVGPGILMAFDAGLRQYAEKKFHRETVQVVPNTRITAVRSEHMEVEGGDKIPYGLLVWSTGIVYNPFIDVLNGVSKDPKTKSLKVDPHLRALDTSGKPMENVFAIGDNSTPEEGDRLPATAQVASQQATYMSKTLNDVARGKELATLKPFKWNNYGSMVFIGDYRAMMDRTQKNVEGMRGKLAGFLAWIVWRSYYVTQAMGWRNKILIPVYWTVTFFFGRDATTF